jgi:hypothetical protein
MAQNTVTNWFGNIVSHPHIVVDANTVDDIVMILKDAARYPSPVRAVGSNHSTSACGTADGGTLIRMKMNRIISIKEDTLVVEAGATHLHMAKALQALGKQLYVNTEIGSLTAGSAACAGTKDASFEGEYGQVGSYVIAVKMVLPDGSLFEASEASQPDLMRIIRSSYGLMGIVYEVTYKIRPLTPMAVHHRTYTLDEFLMELPELQAGGDSMMYYMFPFADRITVEFRRYNPSATGEPNCTAWAVRNHIWGTSGPKFGHDIEETIDIPAIRYGIIDAFNASWRLTLEGIVSSDYTLPPDQIINYPPVSDDHRYTFSLFAFAEETFPVAIRDFYKFCNEYYDQKGYRSNLLYVGYRIAKDQQSLLSYSHHGNVMTLDPVSTANKGWDEYLAAYNEFCSERNGIPLFNQTANLTPAIMKKAVGDRLQVLADTRKEYDPADRLLNQFFRPFLT